MRYYGPSYDRRKEDPELCVVFVCSRSDPNPHQCSFRRGHGKDGLLCKKHARVEASGKALLIPEDE